jgi:hypothetical protein
VPIAGFVLELDVLSRARQPLFSGGPLRRLAGFVMSGVAFREDVSDLVSPPALVLDNPIVNIGHRYSPIGLGQNEYHARREAVALPGPVVLRAPNEHLFTSFIEDPQGIWLLRHVQGLEERPSSDLRILQIACVMFNLAQSSMGMVRVPDPKELDDKRRRSSTLLEVPIGLSLGGDWISHRDRSMGKAARVEDVSSGKLVKLRSKRQRQITSIVRLLLVHRAVQLDLTTSAYVSERCKTPVH